MKKHILEALGVPENILLSGEKLYKDLLKQLSYESNETFDEDTKFEITFNTNLQVNELNIRKVHVQIELDFVNTDKILMAGMGYSPRFTHNVKKFVSMSLQDFSELYISVSLYLPDRDVNSSEIFKFLKDEKKEILPSLSHELKHAYDNFKEPEKPLTHTADYSATSNFGAFGIKPLRIFFHYLYLATLTETLVKPTEVASRMMLSNVNKTQFLEFLLNDKTFKEFMVLKNYTFEDLVSELKSDIETIKTRLRDSDIDVPESEDEIINMILELAYVNLTNDKGEMLNHLLISGEEISFLRFMEFMGGIDPESDKGKYFYKNILKFSKHLDNPLNFYKNEIKLFNFVGEKMVKKIGKLYEMAHNPEDTHSNIIRKIYVKSNTNEKRT